MIRKLQVYVLIAPRWFALPVAFLGVLLGVVTGGSWGTLAVLALFIGATLMSFGHIMNSVLDWAWTGLDKGEEGTRSFEKPYTGGQNLIANGRASVLGLSVNASLWLLLSALATGVLATQTTAQVWLVWGVTAIATFHYSWAKLHYHPEIPLGIAFGPCAVWLGMSTSGEITWVEGFLVSLPLFLIFGVVGEFFDQYCDADANYPKGGRSLGILAAHHGVNAREGISVLLLLTFLVQGILVFTSVLSVWTTLTLTSLIFFFFFTALYRRSQKTAIFLGLLGIFAYATLLVIGEMF